MKPIRVEKNTYKLNKLEAQLLADLLERLPDAARRGADLFREEHSNPEHALVISLRETSEQCIALRNKLVFDTADSVGHKYLVAYKEAANESDQHRRGPAGLAQWLMHELEA